MDNQNNQPEKKTSLVNKLGFNKKDDTTLPENTSVSIGNKLTTLVGTTTFSKGEHQTDEEDEQKIPEEVLFEWQAPEFVFTQKPIGWFIGMVVVFLLLAGLAAWFKQWLTIGLLAVMTIAIGVWANRKPRNLTYQITNYGIVVGKRKYLFDDFRAYYEYMDYNQPSIDLVPGKRFGTLVSLPLATPDADAIEQVIAHMIPKIEHSEDIIDKLFRRLRF
jgi:hypothetical protein